MELPLSQLTLPSELVDEIQQRARTQLFGNEAEYLRSLLAYEQDAIDEDFSDLPPAFSSSAAGCTEEDWLTQVVPASLQAWEAGSRQTYSAEQVGRHMQQVFRDLRNAVR